MFDNNLLEIMTECKYLFVVFTGIFNNCKVYRYLKATKVMFALLSKGRVLNLPMDAMFEPFDNTVLPYLCFMGDVLYGCEIWGLGDNALYQKLPF